MTHLCLVCRLGCRKKTKVSHLHLLCLQVSVWCKVSISLPCKKTSPGTGPGEALAWDEAPGGCSTSWFGWYCPPAFFARMWLVCCSFLFHCLHVCLRLVSPALCVLLRVPCMRACHLFRLACVSLLSFPLCGTASLFSSRFACVVRLDPACMCSRCGPVPLHVCLQPMRAHCARGVLGTHNNPLVRTDPVGRRAEPR